jgi:shikimate kinase / 3-dehydroquinate synthase
MTHDRGERNDILFIYGPPGVGKSTIGKTLAAELDLPFVDLDMEIEKRQKRTIPEIFSSEGEQAFRTLETEELAGAITANIGVVALGGGTLLAPENRRLVEKHGRVILLEGNNQTLLTRVKNQARTRPLLSGDISARLTALMEIRREHYSSFEIRIHTRGLTPAQTISRIQVSTGRFHVPDPSSKGSGYDVLVRSGSLDSIGAEMIQRGLKSPLMIVTDEHVAGLYLERTEASLRSGGFEVSHIVIPAGEEQKNPAALADLWGKFLAAGLDRGSMVVALGGGVVSDLAGFAAATYLRGLPWVVVPTTLLAMVDAGLGGKTGIDLPQGKNLAGAFHAPSLVVIDPDVLSSLPEEEFRSGLAEAIKAGIIADPALYKLCLKSKNSVRLEELIRRAVAVKVQVIREDPFEKGRRAVLNLGHTIGHAVELVSGFTLRHGEAVAIGLTAETRLAEEMGLAESGLSAKIGADLRTAGLPVEIPSGLDLEEIMKALRNDKKRTNGKIRFALAKKVGEAVVGIEIDEGRIRDAIHSSFARS